MTTFRPLFRFDPGWLFTIAGLALMVVSALLPAQQDLAVLDEQLAKLRHQEQINLKRMGAYTQFLAELKARDPSLLTRLAASQLNLMPEGEAPVLMATSMEHTVSDWIEATVPPEAFEADLVPDTLLTRLASGQRRLWLMGGGALIVFFGLTTGIPLAPSTRFVATASEEQWLDEARSDSQVDGGQPDAFVQEADPEDPPDERIALGSLDGATASAGIDSGFSHAELEIEVDWESPIDAEVNALNNDLAQAEEMSDGKWSWVSDGNVEPFIMLSPAESGDSVVGGAGGISCGEHEESWPGGAD